ncbi:hypothetical protein DL93DRAFT_2094787 [Clavulina sp. PMI_390]|nr:hypothetical protein DL93DRAFT_2094787 [Clavulina sp. PMI_390]
MEELKAHIQSLRSPYCTFGQIPLNDRQINLYFSLEEAGEVAYSIKLPLNNGFGLDPLVRACKQATFGSADLNQNVLDPSYCRALVLEADRFAIAPASSIDPGVLSIISSIKATMLQDTDTIVARLDKLNVYQTGAFSRLIIYAPNRDRDEASASAATARQSDQSQEGHDNDLSNRDCYTTTWGQEVSLSWVAFFSDCLHKVLLVTSGKCVTLSFSLFLESRKPDQVADRVHADPTHPSVPAVEDLVRLLQVPGAFNEARPNLIFHLRHRYGVNSNQDKAETVVPLDPIWILEDLAVVDIKECYNQGHRKSISSVLRAFQGISIDDPPIQAMTVTEPISLASTSKSAQERLATGTPYTYVAYGNETEIGTKYASICMIASLPGHDIRDNWQFDEEHSFL